MRIPSQFNENNLYRRDRSGQGSAGSYRRLVRMVLGLALIVVVMGQASQERIYKPFFGSQASSGPAAPSEPTAAPAGSTTAGDRAVRSNAEIAIEPQDQEIASALVAELPPSDRRRWTALLSKWKKGDPIGLVPSTIQSLMIRLETLDQITDERRESWKAALASLQDAEATLWQADSTNPSARSHLAAWLAAFDEEAFSRVVDGSVWQGGDFDTFYRYLDEADQLSDAGVAAVAVVPLLQQPDVFRGTRVRIAGTVARAEYMVARENEYGVDGYWQLWLRPSDGADRPLVAIVPTVPDLVSQVGPDATLEEGPGVTLVGKYLKRLAYQSSAGADLAPVIVGRLTRVPLAQTTPVKRSDENLPNRVWLTLLVACGAGLALALVAMWRTAVAARRTRQLRASLHGADDTNLQQLDENGK